jgi:hypothetical protein
MRDFLSNQIMSLKNHETIKKNKKRDHENELVANHIEK